MEFFLHIILIHVKKTNSSASPPFWTEFVCQAMGKHYMEN